MSKYTFPPEVKNYTVRAVLQPVIDGNAFDQDITIKVRGGEVVYLNSEMVPPDVDRMLKRFS